jgi:hypothetical protein
LFGRFDKGKKKHEEHVIHKEEIEYAYNLDGRTILNYV